MNPIDDRFERWLREIEQRHLTDLTFPQLSSGLRALSSTYVERRQRLGEGGALDGAGKRAAFALFYGPLHFLLVRAIVQALPGALRGTHEATTLVDLGCGTGAAGSAPVYLATKTSPTPALVRGPPPKSTVAPSAPARTTLPEASTAIRGKPDRGGLEFRRGIDVGAISDGLADPCRIARSCGFPQGLVEAGR